MSAKNKRVAKLETSLTPTDAVLLWMKEAYAHGSIHRYIAEVLDPRLTNHMLGQMFPRNIVADRIAAAVRDAMKGRPADQIGRAEQDATREGDFLFVLAQHINTLVMQTQRVYTLQAGILAEQVRHLLERDAIGNEMERLLLFVGFDTAYPLDTDTAAALEASDKHDVTFDLREDGEGLSEEIRSWVTAHFIAQGKTALPKDAYVPEVEGDDRPDAWRLSFKRPPEADILKAFDGNHEAYKKFRTGEDFQNGLADVPDEEFVNVCDRVVAALDEQIAAGTIARGRTVSAPSDVTEAFILTPLVECEWIDRTVVESAELGWFLDKAGFRVEGSTDPHPLRWNAILTSNGEAEATLDQVAAVQAKVRAHIAKFTGQSKRIAGRDYLSFNDYLSWKNRKARDDFQPLEGIVTASWNDWVNAHGGDQVAELADVKVFTIERRQSKFIARPAEEAFAEQRRRREQVDRIRSWTIGKKEVEGAEFVRDRMFDHLAGGALFGRVSYKTKVAEWRGRVLGYAGEVLRHQAAIRIVERKFFNGHPILWPDTDADLKRQIEMLQTIIDVYNETVAFRLASYDGRELLTDEVPQQGDDRTPLFRAGFRIDLDEVRRLIQPLIATTVRNLVESAKVEMLWSRGDHRDAVNLIVTSAKNDQENEA